MVDDFTKVKSSMIYISENHNESIWKPQHLTPPPPSVTHRVDKQHGRFLVAKHLTN